MQAEPGEREGGPATAEPAYGPEWDPNRYGPEWDPNNAQPGVADLLDGLF